MPVQKVYVIDEPRQTATQSPERDVDQTRTLHSPNNAPKASPSTTSNNWLVAMRAYVLGPVNLVLWPSGKNPVTWAIIGGTALVATILLWIFRGAFVDRLDRLEHGALIGALSVMSVVLLAATAWARAITTTKRGISWPGFLRNAGVVCTLGFIFPGLGLLVAGRRNKAALAVWCSGILIAALIVVKQWPDLMAYGSGGMENLPSSMDEAVLVTAISCIAIGLLAWLVLALDGIRAVSPAARSGAVANRLALVLLASLVVLFATFRPTAVARELELEAARLRDNGLRTLPLALYEVASTLDRGAPTYIVGAAALYDELGLTEKADAKRDLLQTRADKFASATNNDKDLKPDAALVPWWLPPTRTSGIVDDKLSFDLWMIFLPGSGKGFTQTPEQPVSPDE